jgi:hypothetical protein
MKYSIGYLCYSPSGAPGNVLTKNGYEQLNTPLQRSRLKAVRIVMRLPTGVFAQIEPYLQFEGLEGDIIQVACPRMLGDGDDVTINLPDPLVTIS